MLIRTWMVGLCVVAVGCTSLRRRSGSAAGADGVDSADPAAEALAHALSFDGDEARFVQGALPEASEEAPGVQGEGGGTASLAPGERGTVSVTLRDVSAEDPVVALLVQMSGASGFVTVPRKQSTDGTVSADFTVDPAVCADLCDIVHQVVCYEAAMTKSGLVTAKNLTTVLLQCTGQGDPDKCETVAPSGGAAGGDAVGSPPDGECRTSDDPCGVACLTLSTKPAPCLTGNLVTRADFVGSARAVSDLVPEANRKGGSWSLDKLALTLDATTCKLTMKLAAAIPENCTGSAFEGFVDLKTGACQIPVLAVSKDAKECAVCTTACTLSD